MTRYTGPTPAVLALVKARNAGLCLRGCGFRGTQTHHRLPRAMGGTHDPIVNRPDSLCWICTQCHLTIESRRSEAYARGWLVRHGIDEPYQVALTDLSGAMFFLTVDGGMKPLAAAGQAPF